ncbi:MAG: hypothetical protein NWE92_09860 [Candidatus Bathyarchaeota archaeon]|nr:hypothetical protein [Candidatus Bathyarchaeota archaeon]
MKRVNLFLITLTVAIAALIATTIAAFSIFSTPQYPYSWMNEMWNEHGQMGGMMNGATVQASSESWLPFFGALYIVLIALTVIGIIGLAYYLIYPQIRTSPSPAPTPLNLNQPAASPVAAYDSISKTLTPDERKIIDTLQTHNGRYLQKYLKAETGLSRLQTHRIIARLSERGIVSLEKTGNTNQVTLADWLQQKE